MAKSTQKKRADGYVTGIAAEYFVLSQLYRYGYDAYITQGNKKAIDIHVIKNNSQSVSIDVKAVRDYSSWPVTNIKKEKNHFIAYVAYKKKFNSLETFPDVYIVPSMKVQFKITKGGKRSMKTGIEPYKNNWNLSEEIKSANKANPADAKKRRG